MRERLSRISEAVAAAAARRDHAPPELADVVKALGADHPVPSGPSSGPDEERLERLAEVFGLPGPAVDLLAIAVAPSLDPLIAHAYDLLVGRRLGGRVSIGLALELARLRTAAAESAEHLHATSPLRRGDIVRVIGDEGWLDRVLVADDRVRSHLVGDDRPDRRVVGAAIDVVAHHCPAAEQVARALVAGQGLVWVHSPIGTAGVSVAAASFVDAGAECFVIDARLIPLDALVATLRAARREAGLLGAGLVVTGAEIVVGAGSEAARTLAESPVPVVAVGTVGWPDHLVATHPLTVSAPYLTGTDRAAVWAAALDEPLERSTARSLSHLRLSPEEVLVTARHARLLAEARDEPVTDELLRDAARMLGSGTPTSALTVGQVAAHRGSARASFADLVLPARVEGELVRLVRWAERRDEVLARGTLHTKGGKGGGLAALFTGSPGTGKTLAAHVVADELGLELMQIDLSAIVDKYVGETEKNLEKVFRDAESRNVVLFFDEADALFGSRSAVQDAHDRYANQEVSYLLQRMEHFDGITVLATNLRGNLDQAFQRRMQFIVHFPDPDEETRHRLWQQHLDQAGAQDLEDPVDVTVLARAIELAGGDIRNIVLAATYDAAVAGRTVGHQLVLAAALREYQKLGRREPVFR